MFGFKPVSADGTLGPAPAPPPQPAGESFNAAVARQAREHSADQLRKAGENASLGVDRWNSLTDSQRFAIRLAVLFDERDIALARDLRALVKESLLTGLAPVVGWHRGLGLPGFPQ